MGERRGACRIFVEKRKGKNHTDDQSVDGRTIIRKDVYEVGSVGMVWLDEVQDRTDGGLL
jgi:hypothetical protein